MVLRSLALLARRLIRAEAGNVAIIFGLTLPAVIALVGAAVDYGRAASARQMLSSALDAAVLAAVNDLSAGTVAADEVERTAQAYFEANAQRLPAGFALADIRFEVDAASNRVTAAAQGRVPGTLLAIAGFDWIDFSARASAVYNPLRIELALVLDVTGSMAGAKIRDLKDAARDLVGQLLPAGRDTDGKVRIALVPYSNAVNVGGYGDEVIAGYAGGDTCVTERAPADETFSDVAPRDVPQRHMFPTRAAPGSCTRSTIRPMTADAARLVRDIDRFDARGLTAGHVGIAWGWYALSPRWATIWPAEARPANYRDDDVMKVAVIMTDGEFNTAYEPRGNSPAQARRLCEAMAGEGIRIYTVAFQAPRAAERLLRDCTSADGRSFAASTGTALREAFAAIAEEIRRLRIAE